MRLRRSAAGVGAAGLLLLLTACGDGGGGGSSTATSESTAAPQASEDAGPGGLQGGPGGLDSEQFAQIQQCLAAAGIELPDRGALPSGAPSGDFSPPPEGELPSGAPGQGGGPGAGGFGLFQDPDVQAALTACGIELPAMPDGPPQSTEAQSSAST